MDLFVEEVPPVALMVCTPCAVVVKASALFGGFLTCGFELRREQLHAPLSTMPSNRPSSAPAVPRLRRVLQMASADEAAGVTNAKYWDEAARVWDEVQDTFATDKSGVIKKLLGDHCSVNDAVIDFGCGGGRYLAFLSPRTRTILGLDISQALLDIAQEEIVRPRRLKNITLRQADIGANGSLERLQLPPCDLAICTNVLISPEPKTRSNMLDLIANSLRPGGRLFVVVPSVSSALNIREAHGRWIKERRRRKMPRSGDEPPEATCAADEARGVFRRAGVRTQHYRLSDIQRALADHGFGEILRAERVEYSWDTEFGTPTRFLDQDKSVPRPHDWCIVATRDREGDAEARAVAAINARFIASRLESSPPSTRSSSSSSDSDESDVVRRRPPPRPQKPSRPRPEFAWMETTKAAQRRRAEAAELVEALRRKAEGNRPKSGGAGARQSAGGRAGVKTLRQAIEAQRRGSELTKSLLLQEATSAAVSTLAASDPRVQAPSRQEAPAVSSHVASAPALAADASSTSTALAPSPALRPPDELAASGSTQSSHAVVARQGGSATPGDSHTSCATVGVGGSRMHLAVAVGRALQQPVILTPSSLSCLSVQPAACASTTVQDTLWVGGQRGSFPGPAAGVRLHRRPSTAGHGHSRGAIALQRPPADQEMLQGALTAASLKVSRLGDMPKAFNLKQYLQQQQSGLSKHEPANQTLHIVGHLATTQGYR